MSTIQQQVEEFLKKNEHSTEWEGNLRRFLSEASQDRRVKCLVLIKEVHRDEAKVLFSLSPNGAHAGGHQYMNIFLGNDGNLVTHLRRAIAWGIRTCLTDRELEKIPCNWQIQYFDFV